MTASPNALATAVLVLAGLGAATAPASAQAAPESCQGRTPTLVATADAEKLQGTEGADVISIVGFDRVEVDARGGDDLVCSSAWSDSVVRGGAGDDTLQDVLTRPRARYDGRTRLLGGPGADLLVGAGGSRTMASYEDDRTGVTIRFDTGSVVAADGTDALLGIRVAAGSPYRDTVVGSDGPDGYTSALEYDGDLQGDVIDLGAGDDSVSAFHSTVDLGPGDDEGSGLDSVIRGGSGDDTLEIELSGTAVGGPGRDVLTGRADMDLGGPEPSRIRLLGGPGADRLSIPFAGQEAPVDCPEYCTRGRVAGGTGRDTLVLSRPGSVVDLAARRGRVPGGRSILRSIEDVSGSRYGDVIRGSARANRIGGGRGDDVLLGGGGDDRLSGGSGRDRADGGVGRDHCRAEVTTSC
ncbi:MULTISPECIES: hypothetical protein [unclassified Nocardioides]|uniref:hypothetical protein n=1 Tax=unclassified Nocardioides TaxID=2615069 RepID=UPI00301576B8